MVEVSVAPDRVLPMQTTPGPEDLLHRLAAVIDAHDWAGLPALLDEGFRCELVHTGEVFDKDSWVRFNADYPGFERFVVVDCVASGDRAVGRARITGTVDGQPAEFAVATFLTARGGRITRLTEVWTDVGTPAPEGTRQA